MADSLINASLSHFQRETNNSLQMMSGFWMREGTITLCDCIVALVQQWLMRDWLFKIDVQSDRWKFITPPEALHGPARTPALITIRKSSYKTLPSNESLKIFNYPTAKSQPAKWKLTRWLFFACERKELLPFFRIKFARSNVISSFKHHIYTLVQYTIWKQAPVANQKYQLSFAYLIGFLSSHSPFHNHLSLSTFCACFDLCLSRSSLKMCASPSAPFTPSTSGGERFYLALRRPDSLCCARWGIYSIKRVSPQHQAASAESRL